MNSLQGPSVMAVVGELDRAGKKPHPAIPLGLSGALAAPQPSRRLPSNESMRCLAAEIRALHCSYGIGDGESYKGPNSCRGK